MWETKRSKKLDEHLPLAGEVGRRVRPSRISAC
jgi:hypothetical protein